MLSWIFIRQWPKRWSKATWHRKWRTWFRESNHHVSQHDPLSYAFFSFNGNVCSQQKSNKENHLNFGNHSTPITNRWRQMSDRLCRISPEKSGIVMTFRRNVSEANATNTHSIWCLVALLVLLISITDSYTEITNFIQGYIDNEVNFNQEGTCKKQCSDYQQVEYHVCRNHTLCILNYLDKNKTRCDGQIRSCQYIESDMIMCPNVCTVLFMFGSIFVEFYEVSVIISFLSRKMIRSWVADIITFVTRAEWCWVNRNFVDTKWNWNRGFDGLCRVAIAFATVIMRINFRIGSSVCVKPWAM